MDDAVDGQIGGFSDLAERSRNAGFDAHFGMGLTPQTEQGAKRLAKPKFRQSNGPQLFQNPAVELLNGVDLLEDGTAMLSQGIWTGFANVR